MRKRYVFSWDLKDDKDEHRLIFKGSKFQISGAWYWKDCAPALFRLTPGTVRSFWENEGRDLEDEYEDRQQDRKHGSVPSKQWNDGVASLKAMCSETGSRQSFFKRRDMVMAFLRKSQSGSVVLYFLQSGYLFRGNDNQKRIAAVNSRKDVSASKFSNCL